MYKPRYTGKKKKSKRVKHKQAIRLLTGQNEENLVASEELEEEFDEELDEELDEALDDEVDEELDEEIDEEIDENIDDEVYENKGEDVQQGDDTAYATAEDEYVPSIPSFDDGVYLDENGEPVLDTAEEDATPLTLQEDAAEESSEDTSYEESSEDTSYEEIAEDTSYEESAEDASSSPAAVEESATAYDNSYELALEEEVMLQEKLVKEARAKLEEERALQEKLLAEARAKFAEEKLQMERELAELRRAQEEERLQAAKAYEEQLKASEQEKARLLEEAKAQLAEQAKAQLEEQAKLREEERLQAAKAYEEQLKASEQEKARLLEEAKAQLAEQAKAQLEEQEKLREEERLQAAKAYEEQLKASEQEKARLLEEAKAQLAEQAKAQLEEQTKLQEEAKAEQERILAEARKAYEEEKAERERMLAEARETYREEKAESERMLAEAQKAYEEERLEKERILAEQAALEEARLKAEEEERIRLEEEARLKAEEEERLRLEEEARLKAEEEERLRLEEEARLKAEEEERLRLEEERQQELLNQKLYEEDADDTADEDMFNDNQGFAKIKVIGVGGAGSNAVNRMIELGIDTAEFVAVNTDKQALMLSLCDDDNKIQIGESITKGLGAGADPQVGEAAAEETKNAIEKAVEGVDLLFIAAGMGGGTGTGAAPVVAKIAKEKGCVTVAVVTKPFHFEGRKREINAKKGIANLSKYVDTIIIIPNDRLLEALPYDTPIVDALKFADDTLRQGICGIADLIATPSLINLDFADVRAILKNQGLAHMGIGRMKGENRVIEAVRQAVSSPLLETTIEGAAGVILNVTGGKDLSMAQVKEAADRVKEIVDPSANIIFGMNINPELQEEIIITLIATGFDKKPEDEEAPKPSILRSVNAQQESKEDKSQPKAEEYMKVPQTQIRPVQNVQPQNAQQYQQGQRMAQQAQRPAEAPRTPEQPQEKADEGKKDVPSFVKRLFGKK